MLDAGCCWMLLDAVASIEGAATNDGVADCIWVELSEFEVCYDYDYYYYYWKLLLFEAL